MNQATKTSLSVRLGVVPGAVQPGVEAERPGREQDPVPFADVAGYVGGDHEPVGLAAFEQHVAAVVQPGDQILVRVGGVERALVNTKYHVHTAEYRHVRKPVVAGGGCGEGIRQFVALRHAGEFGLWLGSVDLAERPGW